MLTWHPFQDTKRLWRLGLMHWEISNAEALSTHTCLTRVSYGQLQDGKSPISLQKFQSLHFVWKRAQPNQTHLPPLSTEMMFYTPRSSLCLQDLARPGTLPHLQPWPWWLHSLCPPLTPVKTRSGTLLPLDVNAENESLWGAWNRIWWKLRKKHLDHSIRAVYQCFADMFMILCSPLNMRAINFQLRQEPYPEAK